MGNKQKFPDDSTDQIELKWWPAVSVWFPYYGTFWETFIGRREVNGRLRPYGLKMASTIPADPPEEIRKAYEIIAEAHYSEFCELAGAHHLLAEAEASYARPGRGDQVFGFIESFNGFYDHLGTVRNMAYRLWQQLSSIQEASAGHLLRDFRTDARTRPFAEHYLRLSGQPSTIADLASIETQVVPIRNHHIHNYGASFIQADNRFLVPLSAEEIQKRFKGSRLKIDSEDACTRMERHLRMIEVLLESMERVLATELSGALVSGGIFVDY